MPISCQKDLFQLDSDVHYLNGAYMSPQLKSVEAAGIHGIHRKNNPQRITQDDFFGSTENVKRQFGKLINSSPERVAIIPSVSYGMANAVQNLPLDNGNEAIIVGEEFPSDYYALADWCESHNKSLRTIPMPASPENGASEWNAQIMESITLDTAAIVISSIHWANGIIFDLKAIGKRCQETDTRFLVDGTQSVGAMNIDVQDCRIDALVCAGYKWLLGPYSLGLAYYGQSFDNGNPIEQSWMNRINAREFSGLTAYTDSYLPYSARYNVGEFSNFVLCPMLDISLTQILAWGVNNIQEYSQALSWPLISFLQNNGFIIEKEGHRASHMFGVQLPSHINPMQLMQTLRSQNIIVSVRNGALRISMHVYNTVEDIEALIQVMQREI